MRLDTEARLWTVIQANNRDDANVAVLSQDFEIQWASVLGPTTTLLARWCARAFAFTRGSTLNVEPFDIAYSLGVKSPSNSGPLMRAFERGERYHVLRVLDSTSFEVVTAVPGRTLDPELRASARQQWLTPEAGLRKDLTI